MLHFGVLCHLPVVCIGDGFATSHRGGGGRLHHFLEALGKNKKNNKKKKVKR